MPIRKLSSEEVGDLQIDVPLQTRGVSKTERVSVTNFGRRPDAIKSYLNKQGYEARKFGPGLYDFAVRRSVDEPWQVVDPDPGKGGITEFLLDILDLGTDIGIGFASGLAATGGGAIAGPGGAIAGGAAGAGAAELGVQAAGEAMGFEGNMDPGEVGMQTLVGGAFPAVGAAARGAGKLISKATPFAEKLALKVGAKVAGVRSTPGMSGEAALSTRAAMRQDLPSFKQAAAHLRKLVTVLGDPIRKQFPERKIAQEILEKDGRVLDIRPMLEKIREFTLKPSEVQRTTTRTVTSEVERDVTRSVESRVTSNVERQGQRTDFLAESPEPKPFHTEVDAKVNASGDASRKTTTSATATTTRTAPATVEETRSFKAAVAAAKDPSLSAGAKQALDDISEILVRAGVDESAVPAPIVMQIKEILQVKAAQKQLYGGVQIPRGAQLPKVFGEAAKDTRRSLIAAHGGPRGPFAMMMGQVDRKTRALAKVRKAIGKDLPSTERFVASLYGRARESGLAMIEDMERMFGVRLKPSRSIRMAEVGSRFGPGGDPEVIPLYTATGQFRTLALGGAGYMAGGPIGAAVGTAAASPAAIVGLVRAMNRGASGFQRIVGNIRTVQIPQSARAAAVAGLGNVARLSAGKSATRQDSGRRRNPNRLY